MKEYTMEDAAVTSGRAEDLLIKMEKHLDTLIRMHGAKCPYARAYAAAGVRQLKARMTNIMNKINHY